MQLRMSEPRTRPVRVRRGTVSDCEWVRRIIAACGFIAYEGPEDGPSEQHFAAEWCGIWAKRLADPDQHCVCGGGN
eukprot:SAG31_NODE_7125_length_1782_cov_1.783720_2_plen_76_part_00